MRPEWAGAFEEERMKSLFKVDGKAFSGIGVESLKRSFRIPDGKNAGDMLSGDYERDIIGTYYDYTLRISIADFPANEYDVLYEILSAPVNSHIVEMPYGKNKTMTYEAMIETGEDELSVMNTDFSEWADLSVAFRAKKPQRLAE